MGIRLLKPTEDGGISLTKVDSDKYYVAIDGANIGDEASLANVDYILAVESDEPRKVPVAVLPLKLADTFDDDDLSSGGLLTIEHSFSLSPAIAHVVIADNDGKIIGPDNVTFTDGDTITVDLSSFAPLTGTWSYLILA